MEDDAEDARAKAGLKCRDHCRSPPRVLSDAHGSLKHVSQLLLIAVERR